MKFIKSGRFRVFALAAGIILICTAALVASVGAAKGAEERRVIEDSADAPPVAAAPRQAGAAPVITPEVTPKPSDDAAMRPALDTDDPEQPSLAAPVTRESMLITEEQAVEACLKVASGIFDLDADKSSLTVTLHPEEEIKDEDGNVVNTTRNIWSMEGAGFSCAIDAASGAILAFCDTTDNYPGSSITEGEFSDVGDITAPDGGAVYLHNCPENIYIKAAETLVNERLANGRAISDIMIDGVQFVWDESAEYSDDASASGTIQVDCHVFMEKGPSYTLSFWGTDEVVLKIFTSHPTQHACLWGYFYEEEAADYPPEGSNWKGISGITEGKYSVPSPIPSGVKGS